MFELRTPKLVAETRIQFNTHVLEAGHCGLFRAPLHLSASLMPTMGALIASAPVENPEDYELDIKVHMLMAGQFPCIPNWHTDMVPRDETGVRFDQIDQANPPMLIWISDGPETEFLARPLEMPIPGSHIELARFLQHPSTQPMTQLIQPNVWWSMDQQTPHRGTQAKRAGWRVFARLTHRSMVHPRRSTMSVLRRHARVYLDAAAFGW